MFQLRLFFCMLIFLLSALPRLIVLSKLVLSLPLFCFVPCPIFRQFPFTIAFMFFLFINFLALPFLIQLPFRSSRSRHFPLLDYAQLRLRHRSQPLHRCKVRFPSASFSLMVFLVVDNRSSDVHPILVSEFFIEDFHFPIEDIQYWRNFHVQSSSPLNIWSNPSPDGKFSRTILLTRLYLLMTDDKSSSDTLPVVCRKPAHIACWFQSYGHRLTYRWYN